MKLIRIIFYLLLFLSINNTFAQQPDTTKNVIPSFTNNSEPQPLNNSSSLLNLNADMPIPDKIKYNPIFGFGSGVLTYFGDVKDKHTTSINIGKSSLYGCISRNINEKISFNLFALHGWLSGNERTLNRNLNFQTEILSGGINFVYNFNYLFPKPQCIYPFATIGLETFQFNSKGDLKDANGNLYYYWSDGSIRNIEETPANENSSIILNRDYVYETDLRDLNIDNLGSYSQLAFGIPIGIGIDIAIHKRVTMKLAHTIHFTLNDYIDNVSYKSINERKGNKAFDRFNYSYVSFYIDLFPSIKNIMKNLYYETIDFSFIETDDNDNDGVRDFDDRCPNTPASVKVDLFGCPLDTDGDGIPDYIDIEPATPKGEIVNSFGAKLSDTEKAIFYKYSEAVERKDIDNYFNELYGPITDKPKVEIPTKFKSVDTNKDGYISADELMKAVDNFFELNSELTIDDIYELNDFFFNQ